MTAARDAGEADMDVLPTNEAIERAYGETAKVVERLPECEAKGHARAHLEASEGYAHKAREGGAPADAAP